jgi:hypothetical protein
VCADHYLIVGWERKNEMAVPLGVSMELDTARRDTCRGLDMRYFRCAVASTLRGYKKSVGFEPGNSMNQSVELVAMRNLVQF